MVLGGTITEWMAISFPLKMTIYSWKETISNRTRVIKKKKKMKKKKREKKYNGKVCYIQF